MIVQTSYKFGQGSYPILLICPHDSDGQVFFAHFPMIFESLEANATAWFKRYLRIEQDYGAAKLAHTLAKSLCCIDQDLHVTVLELDYPRGIIDGGRQVEHCIRPCLPPSLIDSLRAPFLAIHQAALVQVRAEVERTARLGGLVIDLHTMAPYTPKCFDAGNGHVELSFAKLEAYVRHFTDRHLQGEQRGIDLITANGNGHDLADRRLSSLIENALAPHYPLAFNTPFAALDHYMMSEYLQACAGIAIDIPKHLLARAPCEGQEFRLDEFELCQNQLGRLAQLLAKAIAAYFY